MAKEMWERKTEADIEELITAKVSESLHVEFKACASLENTEGRKKEISKDVSAFANADGGTIFYGLKADKETHEAIGVCTSFGSAHP